jgi:hypothetical protein
MEAIYGYPFCSDVRLTCILQMVNGDVLHSYKHIGHKRTLQSTVVQSASVKCLNMSWLDTIEEILDLVISYFFPRSWVINAKTKYRCSNVWRLYMGILSVLMFA